MGHIPHDRVAKPVAAEDLLDYRVWLPFGIVTWRQLRLVSITIQSAQRRLC
jgi:hypothetical protein